MRLFDSDSPNAAKSGFRSNDLQVLKQFLPYIWPKGEAEIKARVVLSMICLLLAKGANAVVPIFYGRAVDAIGGHHGLPGGHEALIAIPVLLIAAYGLSRTLSLAFGELRDAIFVKVGQRAMRRIALRIFRHLHALSLRFHLERQTGGLSRSIERGTRAIDTLLTFALFNSVPTFVEMLMAAAIMWWRFGISYAVVTLLMVIVFAVYTIKVTNWRLDIRRRMNESDSKANTRAIDSLINHETVKYFTNEAHEASRYDHALERYEGAAVKGETTLSLLNIGQSAIISVSLTAIMILACHDIIHGTLTVGDFVAANAYLGQIAQPLGFFGRSWGSLKQALVDMEKMFDLLEVDAEIADLPGARPLEVGPAAIEFRDVSFAYDPRRPILNRVSFTVPSGKTVAVVGPSGAGKSTLSRLLFRFYDVDDGAILIDGQDVRDITQLSLRAAVGIVPQDTVLFNDTLYYNIAYGRPSATDAEIRNAARLAHIDGFIQILPDGYDTLVGERGLKLSGGEKQRVAIARALLKDPPIMVFDEATSALDTNTEREIQANLREAARGRTVLVVAHRLSTVIDADEILVLDNGTIVERGRFEQLMALGGVFSRMWERQQKAEREAEEREGI